MAGGYQITFTEAAIGHLEGLKRYERNLVVDGIKVSLSREPTVATRHRKLLRQNPLADWELRIEPFRVFYEVDEERQLVRVLAVGRKERERLLIGDREFKL